MRPIHLHDWPASTRTTRVNFLHIKTVSYAALLLFAAGSTDPASNIVCQSLSASRYETVEECQAELTSAISTIPTDQDKTYGKCVEIDPALLYEDAEIVWDVTHQGGIEVTLEVINPHMSLQSVASVERRDTYKSVN